MKNEGKNAKNPGKNCFAVRMERVNVDSPLLRDDACRKKIVCNNNLARL